MERPNTAKGTLRRERRTDWCDCMDGSECNSCDPGVCNSFVGFLFLLLNMGCFTMKTKKFISLLVMLGITVAMLTACGGSKLDGTYRSQGLISQSFTFDGDQVTMSAFGINASGTYRIEGNQIIITYTLFGQEYTWEQSFSQSGNVINIGGTEFKK